MVFSQVYNEFVAANIERLTKELEEQKLRASDRSPYNEKPLDKLSKRDRDIIERRKKRIEKLERRLKQWSKRYKG